MIFSYCKSKCAQTAASLRLAWYCLGVCFLLALILRCSHCAGDDDDDDDHYDDDDDDGDDEVWEKIQTIHL